MTSTPQTHRPNRVRPRTIQNRIQWVLGQHGINVNQQTIESIWHGLTSGDDPRPQGVPAQFTFQGVKIAWPAGVGRRLLRPAERHALNTAYLKTRSLEVTDDDDILLDSEDNAFEGRNMYEVLWRKTQMPGYVDPTSVQTRMAELVKEATVTGNDGEQEHVLCWHRKPGGRLRCTLDQHHDGLHTVVGHKDKPMWSDDGVVIRHHTTSQRTVKAQAPKPASELDDLLAQLNDLTAIAL